MRDDNRTEDWEAHPSRRRFLKTAGALGAAALAGPRVLPFNAFWKVPTADAQEARTLRIVTNEDIDTLDPAVFRSVEAYVSVKQQYDQFITWKVKPMEGHPDFRVSHTGEGFLPMVAKSWSWSEDNTKVTFQLRDDIKFWSGRPINEKHAKYAFDRGLLSPGYMKLIFEPLLLVTSEDQFIIEGPYSFSIKMHKPNWMALDIIALNNTAFVDFDEVNQHTTEEDPWGAEWMRDNVAGSGPFRLVKRTPGVEYIYEAVKDYWQGPPNFDRVVVKVVPNNSDRVLLLKKGEVDIAKEILPKDIPDLMETPGVKVFNTESTWNEFVGMNNEKEPFNDVRVRQAINYAIPRDAILNNVMHGLAVPMTTPIAPLTPLHDPSFFPYKHDLQKARELLTAAGIGEKYTRPLTIGVRIGWTHHEQMSVWIKGELDKIGLITEIKKEPISQYRENKAAGRYDFSIDEWHSWVNDPFYHLLWNFHSKSVFTNVVLYKNARVDQLIDEGMFEPDPEKRKSMASEAQKIIVEEAPWGFLHFRKFVVPMRENVMNFERNWDHLERWYPIEKT